MTAQVFSGIRVVDFSQGMAGAMATMIMADNGAEVIKIEPPAGDWARQRPGFLMWNRGKRSIVLDLDVEQDRAYAATLALGADVMVEGFRPGEAESHQLNYEVLKACCPSLIYCSISGFGAARKYEKLQPYDEIVSAKTGRLNGNDELGGAHFRGRPIFLVSPVSSYGAAALAVQGIAAALLVRLRTGLGQKVSTSLLDGAVTATMRRPYERDGGKVVPSDSRASGAALVNRIISLCFMTAKCKDGGYIQMCARQDLHFRNWLHCMDLTDLLEQDRFKGAPLGLKRQEDVDALEQVIRRRMGAKTVNEWMELFMKWEVGADPFLTPGEFLQHPQMLLNERIIKLEDANFGLVTQIGPLVLFSETPSRITSSAPSLGQHQGDLPGLLERVPAVRANAGASVAGGAPQDMKLAPFSGITVLELATFVAGPIGGALIAELGARVIKIEPLRGDSIRRVGLEVVHIVRGKESIAVDLKTDQGRELLHRIVRISDALIHNSRAGAVNRIGADYETLKEINPRLVYLAASSYGSKGTQSYRPAFHSTPHALCGAGILQGGTGNAPVDDSYPDPCAGIGAAVALSMGLLAREKTGRGQYMETTMLACAAYVHSDRLTYHEGIPTLPMLDGKQYGLGALNRLYQCQDGWLMLAALQTNEWEQLARTIGHPELLVGPRFMDAASRTENDQILSGLLENVFASESAAVWEMRLNDVGVGASAVSESFEGFMVENGIVEPAAHPSFGTYFSIRPRIRFSESASRLGRPPICGQHTIPLLTELGYSESELQDLIGKNIVSTGTGKF